jgi:hypothetical protein
VTTKPRKPYRQTEITKENRFYHPEGMARVVEIVRATTALEGQRRVAEAIGVDANTFTNLWKNANGKVVLPLLPTTMLTIAQGITDPDTGMRYSNRWRMLAQATNPHGEPYFPCTTSPEESADYWIDQITDPETLERLKAKIEAKITDRRLSGLLQHVFIEGKRAQPS